MSHPCVVDRLFDSSWILSHWLITFKKQIKLSTNLINTILSLVKLKNFSNESLLSLINIDVMKVPKSFTLTYNKDESNQN